MKLKLVIVDDEVRLAKGLMNDLLEFKEIGSITIHNSGLKYARELMDIKPSERPDAIIMDISMGSPDEGIQATRLIKQWFPEIQIIIFTISDEDERVFDAFRAGAMGYLLKNESPSFILKTIMDVKQGGAQMSPLIARKAIRFFAEPVRAGAAEELHSDVKTLSTREMEILEYVSKGLTYQQIAERIFVSPHTIKKHMANIFVKLQVKNKIEALKKAGIH